VFCSPSPVLPLVLLPHPNQRLVTSSLEVPGGRQQACRCAYPSSRSEVMPIPAAHAAGLSCCTRDSQDTLAAVGQLPRWLPGICCLLHASGSAFVLCGPCRMPGAQMRGCVLYLCIDTHTHAVGCAWVRGWWRGDRPACIVCRWADAQTHGTASCWWVLSWHCATLSHSCSSAGAPRHTGCVQQGVEPMLKGCGECRPELWLARCS
jgi:hypothetical protein